MVDSMTKRVVAVTQRIDNYPERNEKRDAVDQRLLDWIFQAGFLPVSVPNIFFPGTVPEMESAILAIERWLQVINPGALLLSGGNDIGEYPERDATEGFLLDWAEKEKIPVLGICRGLQMMAVRGGVDLVRKEGHVNTRHSVIAASDTENWPESVNSYHNWCLNVCPEGYELAVKNEDGTIEAIRHLDLPWEGWMWHPEREQAFTAHDTKRLQRLFSE